LISGSAAGVAGEFGSVGVDGWCHGIGLRLLGGVNQTLQLEKSCMLLLLLDVRDIAPYNNNDEQR